jgi:hypothetical protein
MKAVKYMDEEIVIQKGVELLIKGLGPMEAIRFMGLSKQRKIDGVKRHRTWQKQLDKDLFFNQVFQ